MSFTTGGGLGNQVIRAMALSEVAKKFDLEASYENHEQIQERLGIQLFNGYKSFQDTRYVYNNDLIYLLDVALNIDYNVSMSRDFFQSEELSDLYFKRLNNNNQKQIIMNKNPFKERYQNNNDIYIHIRLQDLSKWTPDIQYYIKAIEQIGNYGTIYVSTDEEEHDLIQNLRKCYPSLKLMDKDIIETVQFASTCKYVILTFGTFSALIGWISYYSTVYYSTVFRPYGAGPLGLFTNKGWNPISI